MHRIIYIILWGLLLSASVVQASEINLLPKPQHVNYTGKWYKLGDVRLVTPVHADDYTAFVEEAGGQVKEKASRTIEVCLVDKLPGVTLNAGEAYKLTVTANRIKVEAVTERGAYWALQTLRQLQVRKGKSSLIKGCEITDWPAFRVRGFMQDVGRSYISVEELKKEIEILSRFKINVFHFHLTENQSWRLESKIFPMLNDSVNTTRMPGK